MAATPRALTGRVLGEFTVGEPLGEGGHGVVYRAEQRRLDRPAVIKVLHARHGSDEATIARFLREAQLASRLDHPYAAHVYAFGAEPDGVLWIAMELVRGTTLRAVLAAQPGGRLPAARAVPLLERLCEVVHTAHEQGIVHRDLKPENVMVIARAGRLLPKLIDLGIARRIHDAAAEPPSPAIVGSPRYMAPEQWRGGALDGRADQYALGVVAFELLAGAPPFTGRTLAELAEQHVHGALPDLPADLPAELGAVIGRALAKAADDRYASVLELAAALCAAAGLRVTAEALPQLDAELRGELAWFPPPIADAAAALEAARNPHQAHAALEAIVRAAVRWLGVLALCAHSRSGPPSPGLAEQLRALHRGELAIADWLALIRALVQPFAAIREAHPIPELVEVALAEPSPFAGVLARAAARPADASEPALRDQLAQSLPALATLLRALGFLASYQVVVPHGDRGALWMGPRRAAPAAIALASELVAGEPTIVDLDGRPVLRLAPLVRVAPPTPEAPDALFVFAGAGRVPGHAARLVAEPHGWELPADDVWPWFRTGLLADAAAPTVATPYRGLAAFTEADAAVFFGREHEVAAFLNRLRDQPLAIVVGPSGAGKSSFVRAGVIPALPGAWQVCVLRPGSAPLAALARLAEWPPGTPALLVVDPLEELFTLGATADEREQFAHALVARLTGDSALRVVLVIRDDFVARAGELGALRPRIARAVTLLASPGDDDLIRTLREPARRAGYALDAALAARMVRAVAGHPGAIALLSFTALRLWELRDRHFGRLTEAAYDAIGGVEGALARHADAVLAAYPASDRPRVREVFRQLVTAEGTRAQVTRDELAQVLGGADAERAIVEPLIDARLLVVHDGDAGAHQIELIHEALITAWPRLVAWRRDDAEGARLRDQLRAAAR
ncbi:MAG TPA: serine/threonine-protein kinase, partial [Kofleriaceae bacterium]|nr:serine/threonine-protein kinase [Kofleriaceae bacterium]